MSKSEWEELLAFHIKAAGLPKPERDVRFHETRRWRVDFLWREPWMIACEVEGGVWVRGRHTRGSGFLRDLEKYNELALAGYILIRVHNS